MYIIKRNSEQPLYIGDYSLDFSSFIVTDVPYYYEDKNIAITTAEILNYLASLKKDTYRWEVLNVTETKEKINLYKVGS